LKIKDGFILKEVAGSFIVVPVGDNLVDFSEMITLNETGAFLWEALQSKKTTEQLVDEMVGEYDVSKHIAKADVEDFIELLKREKLLED
jgi:myo-inositol-1-phosphate synthase